MKLRGKPISHWNRRADLVSQYQEADAEMRAAVDSRIDMLEALTDEQFAALDAFDLAQWLDAWQGFGDDFSVVLADALPQAVPIPAFTAEHAKAFLFIHEPDYWPVVAVRNPWEPLVVGGRDQIMSGDGEYPMDAMSSQPQLWWMRHGNHSQPHLQLGFWPADGSQPLQLVPCAASLHPKFSHSLQPHYVPPKAGHLRARVAGWAASQNRDLRDEVGPWSAPVLLSHAFVSTKARDAWTPTWIDDVPQSQVLESRSGGRYALAEASDLVPRSPSRLPGSQAGARVRNRRRFPLSPTGHRHRCRLPARRSMCRTPPKSGWPRAPNATATAAPGGSGRSWRRRCHNPLSNHHRA